MADRLYHRGPDASGVEACGPVALGHKRLSIIDVAERSNQPLTDHTGACTVVFNGEIYNYKALRADLKAAGAVFQTAGDTEVILEAYKAWGLDCLERLDGMFAFALWDRTERHLFMARDRMGEKPLFYAQPRPGELLFASEPGALALDQRIGRSIDPIALGHFLALNYTLGERSLFEGVLRLAPAHALVAKQGRAPQIWRYWDLAQHFKNKRTGLTPAQAAEELLAAIDRAVETRMVSDVPLGAFLSGGVDSATVIASMAQLRQPPTVSTFSVGFEDDSFSELDQASASARALGVTHRDEVVMPDRDEIMLALRRAAEEPLADTSVLPTFYLSKFARRNVKVVLSGDGGDECFGGYETYSADQLHHALRWLPGACSKWLHSMVDRYWPVSFNRVSFDYKLRQFLAGLSLPSDRAHYFWREIQSIDERCRLVKADLSQTIRSGAADAFSQFANHFVEVRNCHYLDQSMYIDMKTWLPDAILVKVDRASMASSLEARAPFLDHRLVELAASLPVDMKVRGRTKKYLLKKSQEHRLPASVLRRRKQGFSAPVTHWLNGPLHEMARDTLSSEAIGHLFEKDAIDRLWQEQMQGIRDNGMKLLGLVCLGIWLELT